MGTRYQAAEREQLKLRPLLPCQLCEPPPPLPPPAPLPPARLSAKGGIKLNFRQSRLWNQNTIDKYLAFPHTHTLSFFFPFHIPLLPCQRAARNYAPSPPPSDTMVADADIYPPPVSHYLRFVATTVGRDKLLRVIQ